MMKKLWQAFVKMWRSECTVCGYFAPSRMKEDGVCLYCVGDREASAEIERISPSNAELRVWASESNPPKDLDQQQEERPW